VAESSKREAASKQYCYTFETQGDYCGASYCKMMPDKVYQQQQCRIIALKLLVVSFIVKSGSKNREEEEEFHNVYINISTVRYLVT
jgi:hypothetical protein